jgi:hypothetical protein
MWSLRSTSVLAGDSYSVQHYARSTRAKHPRARDPLTNMTTKLFSALQIYAQANKTALKIDSYVRTYLTFLKQ